MMTLHMTPEEMNTLDSAELALTVAEHPTAVHPAHWPACRIRRRGSSGTALVAKSVELRRAVDATLDWCCDVAPAGAAFPEFGAECAAYLDENG